MEDARIPSLERIRALAKRWWDTPSNETFALYPMRSQRRCGLSGSGCERNKTPCAALELHMLQYQSGIFPSTQVLGDTLRLVHAGSADPQVFHLLWSRWPWCPELSSCAFCDGLEGQASVRIYHHCFRGDPHVLEAALFDWDEAKSTSEFRELYAAVQAAIRWTTGLGRVQRQRLQLELFFADGIRDEDEVPVAVSGLQSLLARYREMTPEKAFCEIAHLQCTNSVTKIPVAAHLPIVKAMAFSNVPTTLCYSGYCRQRPEEWIQQMMSVIGDPAATIVALTTPTCSDPQDLIRLASALQQNTTLQHLDISWTLSPEPETRRRQLVALANALFSAHSKLRLKTLEFQIDNFEEDDGHVLMSCVADQDVQLIEQVVWKTLGSSVALARIFAQVLARIGVRSMMLVGYGSSGPTSWDVAFAFLQQSRSLVDVTIAITGDTSVSESLHNMPWPAQTQLRSLKIQSQSADPDELADAVDLLLSRIGFHLTSIGFESFGILRFNRKIIDAVVQYCPKLRTLSVEGADNSLIDALCNAFDRGRLHISSLDLATQNSSWEQYDPVIKMLSDPSHPASSVIQKLTLGLFPSVTQADKIRVMLSRNHVLRTLKVQDWEAPNASEIFMSPGSYVIEPPSVTRRVALVGSLNVIFPELHLPRDVLRLIFELSGRSRRRTYLFYTGDLDL